MLDRPDIPVLWWLYNDSILAPWAALFVVALPPAVLIMWHAFRTLPHEMFDAAAVDGAGSLRQLCCVALPCRAAALGLAWIVAFAVALGDLGASVLVLPPGVNTLALKIFDLLHSGVEDQVAGICLALVALFAAAAAVAAWLAGRLSGR